MDQSLTNELLALLEKTRAATATGDDYARIAAIITTDQTGELIALADQFLASEESLPSQHITPYNYDHWQQAFLEIKANWQQQHTPPAVVRRMPSWQRWSVAASIMLLMAAGVYFVTRPKPARPPVASTTTILPGKDGAILTLGDGSQVLLDSVQNAVVAHQAGTTVKIVEGTLLYEGSGHEVVYNELSTPKAREFQLILPDGTKAWLNSASSIRYPTSFTGNERKVSVTGEVYFEVTHLPLAPSGGGGKRRKMPFIVNVNNQTEVEVLGTHFNVKAYKNEACSYVTLFEGKVVVHKYEIGGQKSDVGGQKSEVGSQTSDLGPPTSDFRLLTSVTLKPGQQAQIIADQNKLTVQETKSNKTIPATPAGITVTNSTDMNKVMAWKNGVFDFNDIAFADAMYQLERWYNIQVVYEKGIPTDVELSGKISKDVTLNELVTILEKIGVQCTLEGRQLHIRS